MMNRSNQKGGDGSTNIQAENLIIQTGIDEKRAREIYQEMNLQLRAFYTEDALTIAKQRVAEFEDRLMPKMEKVEGALAAFADPGFQLLLVDAQKAAAATERPQDYDLLSELLIHRFQKGKNRETRAGITLAVEVVDKISDESLLSLTVAHAVNNFAPLSGEINQGLDVLNNLFGKLLYGELPSSQDWLDHLDILDCVRLDSLHRLKKVHEYYPEILSGYVDVGINKKSANYAAALDVLKTNNLPPSLLVDHALNPSFQRIPVINRNKINTIPLIKVFNYGGQSISVPAAMAEGQLVAINAVYDLYDQDGGVKQNNIDLFMGEWDKRPHLKTLRTWWDSLAFSFKITSVGKVLAHANAQRCDNTLPPLN